MFDFKLRGKQEWTTIVETDRLGLGKKSPPV